MERTDITGCASRRTALFLRENHRGTVLMANSAGIYLDLEGQILLLCDESWGMVPNGIGIADFPEAAGRLALQPGDKVVCHGGALQAAGQWIRVEETEEYISWGNRVFPDRCARGRECLRQRKQGLAPLVRPLLEQADMEGDNPWCTLALPRLEKLMEGLQEEKEDAIDSGVKTLLGLGPGLTPSGDDVLCGLLWGLRHSSLEGRNGVRILVDAVCRESGELTHPVSAAYLKAIARGEVFGRLAKAWSFLTGAEENGLHQLLEVGSSSGGDMLLGLLLAAEMLRMEDEKNGGTDCTGTVG